MTASGSPSIFISYTREDSQFAERLWEHLADFRARPGTSVFLDRKRISPGYEWESAIQESLESHQLFVLLLSPPFLNSEFCIDREARRALERAAAKQAHVFVVLVGACTYDELPSGRPGGLVLGDIQRPEAHRALMRLQAAGPFDKQGRLAPLNLLSAPEQDIEWEHVVDRIYEHFGLAPGSPVAEPAERPDSTVLVGRCDRTALVKALGHVAKQPASGLVVTTGHRLEMWLFRRVAKDLEQRPYSIPNAAVYFFKGGNCVSADDFDQSLVANANLLDGEDDEDRTPTADDVFAWLGDSGTTTLVVGFAIKGASVRERLREARRALRAAADWMERKSRSGVRIIVVLGIESGVSGFAGQLERLLEKIGINLDARLGRQLRRLGTLTSAHWSIQPLRDYLPTEVADWLNLEDVKRAVSRNTEVHNLIMDLSEGEPCNPTLLLKLCNKLYVNEAPA